MKEQATSSLMNVNSHCITTNNQLSTGLWSDILSIFLIVTLVDCKKKKGCVAGSGQE
jgi:hypothetical protein